MQTNKTKSMTGIIIALSVLLVLSLTATIALAYFSASRTATTTITFGSGITLEVSNIAEIGETGKYVWMTDKTAAKPTTAEVSAGSSPIKLNKIGIRVTGADAFVAVRATIANTGGIEVAPIMASNWTQVGTSGWYVYNYNSDDHSAQKMTIAGSASFTDAVQETSIGSAETMNALAGAVYECTVEVKASDEIQGLEVLINQDIDGDSKIGVPTT